MQLKYDGTQRPRVDILTINMISETAKMCTQLLHLLLVGLCATDNLHISTG